MSQVNWREILGWSDDQLEELRFSGFSFLRQGQYEKARLFYKALVILDPQNAYDAQTLGALYLQMNEPQEALAWLNHALRLDPFHEPTLLNKAKALLTLHENSAALDLARALEKSADPSIAGDASALVYSHT